MSRPHLTRHPFRTLVGGLLLMAFAGGCLSRSLRPVPPPRAALVYPQLAHTSGEVRLQPRHARETREFLPPGILEPGDWVETGPTGKAEILLPATTLRLFANTRVQIPFQFRERTVVASELRLERGEILVARPVNATPHDFSVQMPGLHVEVPPTATILAASADNVHRAVCYRGRAEARNVRVRGQTVIRLRAQQVLTLDDHQTIAFLEEQKLGDDWRRWERDEVLFGGRITAPPSEPAPEETPSAPASAAP